jgi:hypothetical protein
MRHFDPLAIALTLSLLWPASAGAQGAIACDASRVESLIGRPFSPEVGEQAQRAANAASWRAVGPGMVSSSDRRPDRLNVEIDATRTIRGFWCE